MSQSYTIIAGNNPRIFYVKYANTRFEKSTQQFHFTWNAI